MSISQFQCFGLIQLLFTVERSHLVQTIDIIL